MHTAITDGKFPIISTNHQPPTTNQCIRMVLIANRRTCEKATYLLNTVMMLVDNYNSSLHQPKGGIVGCLLECRDQVSIIIASHLLMIGPPSSFQQPVATNYC